MRRLPRWLLFTAFVVVLAVSALSSLAVVTARESFPQTNGGVVVPALNAKATVLRDAYGVPHIYADSPEDLFAAQGYVAAQDRFFEMDFRRHVTSGRLSELFGPDQFETDVYVRTLGWRHTAEQEARQLSGSTKRYLEAYAAGVNAWMDTRSGGELSLEYAVLGLTGKRYQPDPWTVTDSLAWFKAMSWDLSGNRLQETEMATLGATVGAQRAAELWPTYDLENYPPIVGRGAITKGAFDPEASASSPAEVPDPPARDTTAAESDQATTALESIRRIERSLPRLLGDLGSGGLGSNSFVVSGDRTTTGAPLLANDPHLSTSMPSIFGQVGLHCIARDESCPFDVTGFAFSGVPGVIIGHNTDIAWGLTNAYVDTQDLYLERVRGQEVQYGENFEPLTNRTEQVSVSGEPVPRVITVRSTRHGPLLSDVDGQVGRATTDQPAPDGSVIGVSLRWTANDPSTTVESLFGMNKAKNFDEFRAAAKSWGSPSQNLTYADRFGNIGYQLPGDIPIRGKGDGVALNPGWDPSYDWKGMIPYEELPWDLNPPSGYIVTANQPIIGPDYGRHLSASDSSYGWRSQRLESLINSVEQVSPADAESWFADDTLTIAADIVPALLRVRVRDSWVAEGQRVLVGWDYRMESESAAAAYFAVVYKQILIKTFNDELPEDYWPTGGERWYGVLRQLMNDDDNRWWDDVTTPATEKRDDILLAAMTQARKEITSRLSQDPSGWRWGKLHTVELEHQSLGRSGIAPVEMIFNRGPRQVDGAGGVVNAMAFNITSGNYAVTAGPTMRMLVDLDQLDRSRWINQSGVSGHAVHPHYDDQFALWADNRTIEMVSSRTRVQQSAVDELVLQPI